MTTVSIPPHPTPGHQPDHEHPQVIQVQVTYVGHAPFEHPFHKGDTVTQVKAAALRHFGLEASAADRYTILFEGHPELDSMPIAKLTESHHLELSLALKQEVPKG